MTGQLTRVIEDQTFQADVVKLVYSTSIELESLQLPEVTTICFLTQPLHKVIP
jgi:hypothetical protein